MLEQFLPAALFSFFVVFARVGTTLMLLPGFGERYVSLRVRLLLALAVSAVAVPVVAARLPAMPDSPIALLLALGGEIAVGAFLGTLSRVLMAALQMAGMVIAYQSSLANALVFDPVAAQQGAVAGSFLGVLGLLLIFSTGLHQVMLRAIIDSYDVFTPGAMPPLGDFSEAVARVVARSFLLAMQISAPFILIGVLFTLGIGLLGRLMPQVQVFFIAMPLQIALGFVVLALVLSGVMSWFLSSFEALWTVSLVAR